MDEAIRDDLSWVLCASLIALVNGRLASIFDLTPEHGLHEEERSSHCHRPIECNLEHDGSLAVFFLPSVHAKVFCRMDSLPGTRRLIAYQS